MSWKQLYGFDSGDERKVSQEETRTVSVAQPEGSGAAAGELQGSAQAPGRRSEGKRGPCEEGGLTAVTRRSGGGVRLPGGFLRPGDAGAAAATPRGASLVPGTLQCCPRSPTGTEPPLPPTLKKDRGSCHRRGPAKARTGFEPVIFGLRDRRLTTWPPRLR